MVFKFFMQIFKVQASANTKPVYQDREGVALMTTKMSTHPQVQLHTPEAAPQLHRHWKIGKHGRVLAGTSCSQILQQEVPAHLF